MPILLLDDKQKTDLALLRNLDIKVVIEFCGIAIQFLRNGASPKIFKSAAQKLGSEPQAVEQCVKAIVYLFTESSRLRLSEVDFIDSLIDLAFAKEVQDELAQSYMQHVIEIRRLQGTMAVQLPHYVDMKWRMDMNVASRNLRRDVQPSFLINLETQAGDASPVSNLVQADPATLQHVSSVLRGAYDELNAGSVRRITRNVK